MIMAHRGVWTDDAPESSGQALRNAVNKKFEILELDVRFSAPYTKVSNTNYQLEPSHFQTNGTRNPRYIFLQHDKSDKRAIQKAGTWTFIPGLYEYGINQTFTDIVTKKSSKCGGLKFVLLDKLVPRTTNGTNCFLDANLDMPALLKLDGTKSIYKVIGFPYNATSNSNDEQLNNFVSIVKNNILLNYDKLKDPIDFQVNVQMFGNKSTTDRSVRDLSNTMYTPIFTKYDYTVENADGSLTSTLTNTQKYERAKDSVDAMLIAEQQGRIKFAGCEIVYVTSDENDKDFGWLAKLANYVKNTLKKRVIQFSTIPESKLGAWSGNGLFWSPVTVDNSNYWQWLYDNAATKGIIADVIVTDKMEQFRGYASSVGYNQKPIN
jgi:hypothetical protein